jgi:hypothetical protein
VYTRVVDGAEFPLIYVTWAYAFDATITLRPVLHGAR